MHTEKGNVLLAEDDLSLGYVIKDSLEQEGYRVVLCSNGEQAWQYFQKESFHICLLDIMMPLKDGFEVARKIRQKNDIIPILFLTAKSMEEDKLKGFKSGADDYITKPFSMKELLMRMNVFLRRSKKLFSDNVTEYNLGAIRFSYTELKLFSKDETAGLTQKEADLLKFFCDHSNGILKREEILLNVWGKDDYFLGRSMDVFITKLRKHFKWDPSVNIETIHGFGFRLNVPDS
ncbi:MAG: response regulator transcription factor [Chitinophagaceae bacterium]|nr:response regulator transcription factor [Chitinophagaceae bacterium]